MGYTATTKNIYYIDDDTIIVRNGVHVLFDELHFTAPRARTPLAAQAQKSLGYSTFLDKFNNGKFKYKHKIRLKPFSTHRKPPVSNKTASMGYNLLTSAKDTIINPGKSSALDTDITVNMSAGYYTDLGQPQTETPE